MKLHLPLSSDEEVENGKVELEIEVEGEEEEAT